MRILSTVALVFTFTSLFSCSIISEKSPDTSVLTSNSENNLPQTEWKTQDDPLYTIEYPAKWEVNYTGNEGISFLAISPKDPNSDHFRDYVTLIVQDLKGKDTDLAKFADENTEELRGEVLDSKFVQNEGETNGAGKYREETFTGQQGQYKLLYTQRYYIHNGYGYILSYITELDKLNTSIPPAGLKILNSLKLK